MSNRLTTAKFIEKARLVHGDAWDYSRVNYTNSKTKVDVVCPVHGRWQVSPNQHLRTSPGRGCPSCAPNQKISSSDFINRAREVHGAKYDYSQVDFRNTSSKVTIVCRRHGAFEQLPNSHINLKQGCPACKSNHKLTKAEFIRRAKEIHGETYDYSRVVYLNVNTKVEIGCPLHGWFRTKPINHYWSGSGCPRCAGNVTLTTDQFIEKARLIHGEKYDYSKVQYVNSRELLKIGCPQHGYWWTSAATHLNRGSICPMCSESAVTERPTSLYLSLFVLEDEQFLKLGISCRPTKQRYSHELAKADLKIEDLVLLDFKNRVVAKQKESQTLKQFELFKYEPKFRFAGKTECFHVGCRSTLVSYLSEGGGLDG